jgi:hypothetical protein
MLLPDEIINLILSYREIHPVALLIRESVYYFNHSIFFRNYYKYVLMMNHVEWILKKEQKNEKITNFFDVI